MTLTEAERTLAAQLEAWDQRTLDYAMGHIRGAWPENVTLDRDAFLGELLWHVEHRDDRDDERANIEAIVAARVAEAQAKALEEAADDDEWSTRGLVQRPDVAGWLRDRAEVARNG